MSCRATVLGLALAAVGACAGSATGPTGDLPVELEVVRADVVATGVVGEVPILRIEVRITNTSSEPIAIRPECGGPFGLERWSGSEWEPYVTLADCLPLTAIEIAAGATFEGIRTFATPLGTFRIVVKEPEPLGQRERRSASFTVTD
jgi:hypothetical protein